MLYIGGTRRDPWLDFLRAIAICGVLISHSAFIFPRAGGIPPTLMLFGVLGVELFFVLSGFLVGGILYETFTRRPAGFEWLIEFWINRWLRTLPNYFLFLGLNVLLVYIVYKVIPDFHLFLVFAQSLAWAPGPLYPESWSLAVEELFYLCFPLLLLLTPLFRFPRPVAFLVCGLLTFLAAFLARVGAILVWDADFNTLRVGTVFRLDALMVGVFAYYAYRHWKISGRFFLIVVATTLLTMASCIYVFNFGTLDRDTLCRMFLFPVISLGFALLLLGGLQPNGLPTWLAAVVAPVALWSYSMYLTNFFVVKIMLLTLPLAQPDEILYSALLVACFFVATVLLSALCYRWLERPIMLFRPSAVDWVVKVLRSQKGIGPAAAAPVAKVR
jgi:peptidoglycan/LPS O-acetylase OafA/YrhL